MATREKAHREEELNKKDSVDEEGEPGTKRKASNVTAIHNRQIREFEQESAPHVIKA